MRASPGTVSLDGVLEEYHDFADIFSKSKAGVLADHHPYNLKITLKEGASPPLRPIYSLSQEELLALRKFIDENTSMGFIGPSRSPHGAPVLFIQKKDGSLHLCSNFQGINWVSKKDQYPLPLISDLLDAPRKARIYTKIDLRHAYHLVHIANGDKWKTTFWTRYRSFEWLVMPKGLTNALASFQRFMNNIFADMIDVSIVIYLDDILVYSDDLKSLPDSVRIGSMLGLTSVSSTVTHANIWGICYPPTVSRWPRTKSRPSRTGPNPGKSEI